MRIVRILWISNQSEKVRIRPNRQLWSSADENGKKFDMILSEISKLNSKLSDEIKPRKQANGTKYSKVD